MDHSELIHEQNKHDFLENQNTVRSFVTSLMVHIFKSFITMTRFLIRNLFVETKASEIIESEFDYLFSGIKKLQE